MQVGDRLHDYNTGALAQVGLLPDFVQDLGNVGVSDQALAPLLRSAEQYVRMWESASVGQPATVAFMCAEGGSGLDSSRTTSSLPAGAAVPTGSPGAFSFTASCRDRCGSP